MTDSRPLVTPRTRSTEIQREEKKVQASIKDAAKRNDIKSAKVRALLVCVMVIVRFVTLLEGLIPVRCNNTCVCVYAR